MVTGIGLQSAVRIASHNPYEHRYPGHKVVSREALHLIKHLRANGVDVIVEPDDDRPLLYLSQKGFSDLIAIPVFAFLVNIPVSIMTNLISTWISERAKEKAHEGAGNTSVVLELSEDGRRLNLASPQGL